MKTMCLVAMLVSASSVQVTKDDSCKCLAWKDAFTKYDMSCKKMGQAMCEQFFMRMSHNYCIKSPTGGGEFNGVPYCFVSPQCKDVKNTLKGVQLITDGVAEKGCKVGYDEFLGDKSVDEIEALAKQDKTDRGIMIKMAYDVFPGVKWNNPDAKGVLLDEQREFPYIYASDAKRLTEFKNSGGRTYIDTYNGDVPFGVVDQGKVYEIKLKKAVAAMNILTKHHFEAAKLTKLECLRGCA